MNKLLTGLILGGFSLSAQAALVYLEPVSAQSSYVIGDLVALDLKIDFSDKASIGGGVDVFFDPTGLAFTNWTPEALGDPSFRRSPDVQSDKLNGIAFGNFAGLPATAKVGTLEFRVLKAGEWEVDLEANNAPAGPFYSATDFSLLPVQFNDITVSVNAVPVPAVAWLFGSALLGFVGLSRKRAA